TRRIVEGCAEIGKIRGGRCRCGRRRRIGRRYWIGIVHRLMVRTGGIAMRGTGHVYLHFSRLLKQRPRKCGCTDFSVNEILLMVRVSFAPLPRTMRSEARSFAD